MARSLNRVQLIGYVGKDPEIKNASGGSLIALFSVATTKSWKDKSGKKQDKVEWHQIAAFGKLADIVNDYVTKGLQVFVEGELETKTWHDKKTGEEKKSTGIVAGQVILLGKKEGGKERDNGFSSKDADEDERDYDPWA